ncbi:MAG: hypothetical protein JWR19_4459 [Pedosphaera sp.]|nr:hypothetical protein [Pedosphaera sp.]
MPDFGVFLETAAVLTPVSDETAQWFWRFGICVNSPRQDKSETVRRHVGELLAALNKAGDSLNVDLYRKFPGYDPEQIKRDWTQTLESILAVSQTRKHCRWHMEEAAVKLQAGTASVAPVLGSRGDDLRPDLAM